MRYPICTGVIFALFLPFGATAMGADMPLSYRAPVTKAVAQGQCQGFFGQPISNAMLNDMHAAGCCDVLQQMPASGAVNALERRLRCEGWHAYKAAYGVPPLTLDDLAQDDPPPPPGLAPVVPPVAAPVVAAPAPVVVVPVAPEPVVPAPVVPDPVVPAPEPEPEPEPEIFNIL